MSQRSFFSFDVVLLVRDTQGLHALASADQILQAARLVIDQKTLRAGGVRMPTAVKEHLCANPSG